MKRRKQTVVTGDMKPMEDTLNQVLQEEIKPIKTLSTISQRSVKKVK